VTRQLVVAPSGGHTRAGGGRRTAASHGPGVPAEGRQGCSFRPAQVPPVSGAVGRASGDFDGDGAPDQFVVYQPNRPGEPPRDDGASAGATDENPIRMRFEYAAGGVSDDEFPYPNAARVLGAVDVNGDGADEAVVDLGGATVSDAEFVTAVACRVTGVDVDDVEAFGYGAHSTGAPGHAGAICVDRDGDGRFDAVVAVTAVPDHWPDVDGDGQVSPGDYWQAPDRAGPWSWTRTTWVLPPGTGAMRRAERVSGQVARAAGQAELSNTFTCGPVQT